MSALRDYNTISLQLLTVLPSNEEIARLSVEEIDRLRRISNMLDNIGYLELQRRGTETP